MLTFQEQMKRWAMIADRPINTFEQMVIARPFKHESYSDSWVRMIKPIYSGEPFGVIELFLTPVIGGTGLWEEQVKPMKMRLHNRSVSQTDKFHASLPDEVFQQLVDNVGREQAVLMTTCDLWPFIDIPKLMEVKHGRTISGGIPFELFRISGTENQHD